MTWIACAPDAAALADNTCSIASAYFAESAAVRTALSASALCVVKGGDLYLSARQFRTLRFWRLFFSFRLEKLVGQSGVVIDALAEALLV